ncbi:unnamed protein product [Peronospora farinosa]|uniref:RNA polymerase II-associated protein 3 n=1 Tax=Peronospora farinosa TaxID=134698 RepID=A0AAV0UMC2_9STRA|nr:unnamed protein product [Peronospora farinosa]
MTEEEVQHPIRVNTSQLPDNLSDLYTWEKNVHTVDLVCKQTVDEREISPPRTARVFYFNGQRTDAMSNHLTTKSQEDLEKEEGNGHYKCGDYMAAIKSYSRCLRYNPNNAVVLSNRAMAYLKNQEFTNAEDDCTVALEVDPTHVKSYSRRGTARNSMGKHRLALLDFHCAATLDPRNRQIQVQLQSTRELIQTAIKCSPKRTEFVIEIVGERSLNNYTGEQDLAACEKEESSESQQLKKRSSGTEQMSLPGQESPSSLLPQDATFLQATCTKKKTKSLTMLPKLPKKAPAASYEFGRVWKTLALRGDAEQKNRLLNLRANYLRMVDPPSLRSVFKTAIESDVLCEIFHVLRYGVVPVSETNSSLSADTASFVLAFISELTKVPRFNMTIMLLSDSDKEDLAWVVQYLETLAKRSNKIDEHQVDDLRKLYQLP